ncbi:MFS transporter [Mucilaginibacter conchicola]|uniref:MFS transporter n=1 Tax=Mucilaginibacter conchicola TaxID=2303333 RepID=A0A372NRQ6_9SPHI|nr:MFS transporter [Mucilaginibacter conchicola]RFZ90953.1 MFS transporter [Mucilaginibacter conchicola]
MDKRILPLAIGGLGIGTTEFTIMGLLPDVAGSLHIDIPQAGHFISAYALGVVVGAPILIGSSVKLKPKKVLIGLMVMFTIFNALSAAANSYGLMLAARFLSGLPHGAFFGVGTVVATKLAGKGKEAKYIALMFTGLTIANLLMVPAVTYIGHNFHWRWYFGIVAFVGLLTLLALYFWLPDLPGKPDADYRQELQFLRKPKPWYPLLITAIGFGGLFCWLSYINPLMTKVAGFKPTEIPYIMVLIGLGMVLGNLAGGIITDKIGAGKTTAYVIISSALVLLCIFLLSPIKGFSLVLTFLCPFVLMACNAPVNMMVIDASPNAEMMGAAFMQAAFNVANSAGAYLGGLPIAYGLTYNYPSLVGSGMAVIGFLIVLGYLKRYGNAKFAHVAAGH